jgi:hypothetical protein
MKCLTPAAKHEMQNPLTKVFAKDADAEQPRT